MFSDSQSCSHPNGSLMHFGLEDLTVLFCLFLGSGLHLSSLNSWMELKILSPPQDHQKSGSGFVTRYYRCQDSLVPDVRFATPTYPHQSSSLSSFTRSCRAGSFAELGIGAQEACGRPGRSWNFQCLRFASLMMIGAHETDIYCYQCSLINWSMYGYDLVFMAVSAKWRNMSCLHGFASHHLADARLC